MDTQTLNQPAIAELDLDAIGEALADLEVETLEAQDVVEELEIEELVGEDEQALAAAIEQSTVYENQDAGGDVDTSATAAPEKPAKKASTPKAPSAPRVSRDLTALADSAFVLTTTPPADLAANKTAVLNSRPGQKKIAEKFDNIISSVAAGRKPSTYVMDCFEILSKTGVSTSGELVAGLRASSVKSGARNYSEGTARSQVGQIMVLFDTLGIADRSKQTLTMRSDSSLGAALKAML